MQRLCARPASGGEHVVDRVAGPGGVDSGRLLSAGRSRTFARWSGIFRGGTWRQATGVTIPLGPVAQAEAGSPDELIPGRRNPAVAPEGESVEREPTDSKIPGDKNG